MSSGGARPGAGRKPRAEKFPEVFDTLDRRLADGAPARLSALEYLADGGFEQIEEIYEPAGLIYRDDVTTGEDGKLQRTRVLAFPDVKATDMVCIRRTRSIAQPDRAANVYLLDRFAGKPTQTTEVSGANGAPVEHVHLTLDEWKAQANERRAVAEATLALLDEEADA